MQSQVVSKVQSNNFGLKHQNVDLSPRPSTSKVNTLRELESARVSNAPVTASRNGLEVICGASCETGAQ